MRPFALKVICFICANTILFVLWVVLLQGTETRCSDYETGSCLSVVPENRHFDLLIFGTSHGRSFAWHRNHQRIEEALGMAAINLSKTGGGPLWANIYYDYFRMAGNKADTILYFIDPWVLYSSQWNENHCSAIIGEEPFRFTFLYSLAKHGVDRGCLLRHVRAYLTRRWMFDQCDGLAVDDGRVPKVDPLAVRQRVEGLYPDGQEESAFREYSLILEDLVKKVKRNNRRLLFVFPPTLLGSVPGSEALRDLLERWSRNHNIEWYDLTESVVDSTLFSDHDHLNSAGIRMFSDRYLKPILTQ